MKPGATLRCLTTGRIFTVIVKRKHNGDGQGGVKVVNLKAPHIEMSVREDLILEFFEVIT